MRVSQHVWLEDIIFILLDIICVISIQKKIVLMFEKS